MLALEVSRQAAGQAGVHATAKQESELQRPGATALLHQDSPCLSCRMQAAQKQKGSARSRPRSHLSPQACLSCAESPSSSPQPAQPGVSSAKSISLLPALQPAASRLGPRLAWQAARARAHPLLGPTVGVKLCKGPPHHKCSANEADTQVCQLQDRCQRSALLMNLEASKLTGAHSPRYSRLDTVRACKTQDTSVVASCCTREGFWTDCWGANQLWGRCRAQAEIVATAQQSHLKEQLLAPRATFCCSHGPEASDKCSGCKFQGECKGHKQLPVESMRGCALILELCATGRPESRARAALQVSILHKLTISRTLDAAELRIALQQERWRPQRHFSLLLCA